MDLPSVFMIGWEFPPHNSGGLGTACQGLTKALSYENIHQVFVLPKKLPIQTHFLEVISPDIPNMLQVHVNMDILPYGKITREEELYLRIKQNHSSSMIDQAYEYASVVGSLAKQYSHDVIHGHDWMTYPASLAAQSVSKKPVVLHVHSTEYDRTLNGFVNEEIASIERTNLHKADKIITVSNYTKEVICDRYKVPEYKVTVVHNGVDLGEQRKYSIGDNELNAFAYGKKVIVFVGRMTCQKGPDYFVRIANKIVQAVPNSLFVIAGSGDMYEQIVIQSAGHRLTGKLLFSGFLRNRQKEFLYRRADLFIMPSVSEPFGIVALEAAADKTPIIISKQSGVKEVMPHSIVADYWDIDKVAYHAIEILQNNELHSYLANQVAYEAENVTWQKAARKCVDVYKSMV